MTSLLDAILSRLEEVSEPNGQGCIATRCPFHDDQSDILYLSREHGWVCSRGKRGSLPQLAACLGLESSSAAANETERIHPARIMDLTDLERFPLSDVGNALVFAHLYADRVRFVHGGASGRHRAGDWHIWDGVRWRRDDIGEVVSLASQVWRARSRAAALMEDFGDAAAVQKCAQRIMSRYSIAAMLDLARSQAPIAQRPGTFDQDPWLLCVRNGVIDLQTGRFRESTPSDLLAMQAGAAYEANAECPVWLRFLKEIFRGDADIIEFVQRLLGYSLTGVPADHLVVCFGTGRNGKSTLISTIQNLLGDYAAQSQVATLMPHRAEAIRNDLARLFGKRFVGGLEQTQGGHLDEGLVKQLTGGDRLVARALYQEHEEQVPTFKVWLGVNHKPRIKDTSPAMWERVFLIPFEAFFPREAADPYMRERLRSELPGILNWAIDGCLSWNQQGLDPPVSVKVATTEYREESDVIARFVADECAVEDGRSVGATILYRAYVRWCQKNTESPLSQTAFGTRLAEKGYKKSGSTGRIVYHDLKLQVKL